VVVDILPAPQRPTIARVGDTLVASPASTYQWMLDGIAIAGATGRAIRAATEGTYTVAIGDSNGCSALSPPFEFEDKATARVLIPSSIEASPGERVTVPLVLESSSGLDGAGAESFSATIRFDGSLLVPAGATPVGSMKDGQRIIAVSGARPRGMDSGVLMRLEFIAALGDTDATPIAIDAFDWGAAQVATVTTPGAFRLIGLCRNGGTRLVLAEGSLALKPVRPNPAGGMAEIEYEVVERGRTRLVVSDLLGRTVALLVDEEIAPGRYVVSFDASAFPSGAYIYTLQTSAEKLSRMMMVGK
jgi:hypothetical protein